MKRLILVPALLLSSFVISQAQQSDQQRAGKSPPFVWATQLENKYLIYTANRPLTTESLPTSPQTTSRDPDPWQILLTEEPSFVWISGALYTRLPGVGTVPVPGGGASGCFSLDLPNRTGRMKAFVVKLEKLQSQ